MNVTDKEMAEVLDKTLFQIQEMKKTNLSMYQFLKIGVFCKKLNLDAEDLKIIYEKKVTS